MQRWDFSQWCQALLNLYAGRRLSEEVSMHPLGCHHVSLTPHWLPTSSNQPMCSTLLRIHSSYFGLGIQGSPLPALLPRLAWARHHWPGHPIPWSLQSRVFLRLGLSRVASCKQGSGLPTSHTWMVRCVISAGGPGIAVPWFQCKVLCSPQILKPSTLALYFKYSGSLQFRKKDSNFTLTSSADITSSFTYVINVGWRHFHYLFLLHQHCTDNSLHDHRFPI